MHFRTLYQIIDGQSLLMFIIIIILYYSYYILFLLSTKQRIAVAMQDTARTTKSNLGLSALLRDTRAVFQFRICILQVCNLRFLRVLP